MIDKNIFSKERNFHGVKGLIFIGNKILVYRRDNNTDSFPLYIDLPGGAKELGESPFETFKRWTAFGPPKFSIRSFNRPAVSTP